MKVETLVIIIVLVIPTSCVAWTWALKKKFYLLQLNTYPNFYTTFQVFFPTLVTFIVSHGGDYAPTQWKMLRVFLASSSLPRPGGVCLWLAGATFALCGTVVCLVGQNKQFSPRLNDRNDLGMCLRGFKMRPGAGSDCITGPAAHINRDVY